MNTIMKKKMIAMPVVGYDGMDSKLSEHFGRSPGFIVADIEGRELTYLNTGRARGASECAPITALARAGARVVVAKSMGRGAMQRCHVAGMQILQATGGTVSEVLQLLRDGQSPDFPDAALCNHHSHHSDGKGGCGHGEDASC